MCNFLSALVLQNGDIVCQPEYTDSHEDLVVWAELRDQGRGEFVRVELSPPDIDSYFDVDKYVFKLDEEPRPDWFDEALEARTIESLKDRIHRMILDGAKKRLLLGGCWMIRNSEIGEIKAGRVLICTSATVDSIYGSARVDYISGSATVGSIYGSATVGSISDSATVDYISGSATILKDERKCAK